MTQLTQARMHELFDYSPVTGLLYTKTPRGPWGKTPPGTPLVCARLFHPDGRPKYAQFSIDEERWYHHRAIWFWMTGALPINVDHNNRDICCNAWHNLREATVAENAWNRNKQSNNTSGFKGVVFRKDRGTYVANVRANGKIHRLGSFVTAEAAHEAYKAKSLQLHGRFWRDDQD